MNLTWHIVKKDLRAFRWPLGLWLLCIVAKLGVGVILLNSSGEEGTLWFSQMDALAMFLAAGELLSFVLVAALIQEDLMVGTTAFWMTRPISGARLLRAKLLTIGLAFLVMPVLVTLPWWLGCNYGSGEIAWAAAETVAVHALVVLAALMWSAVTDGLGRFLMWTLVTLAATPLVTAILGYYLMRQGPGAVPEVVATRVLVMVALLVIGTLTVLIHQYLTRHTWRSIGILGGTLGLCILTLSFWPWAWNIESRVQGYLIGRAEGEWPVAAEPPGLRFTPGQAEFSVRRDRPSRPGALTVHFRAEGLSESDGFISYSSEHSWQWPDGTSEAGYTTGLSSLDVAAREKARAFAMVNRDPRSPEQERMDRLAEEQMELRREQVSMVSFVPSATMARIRSQPPAYRLQARLRLMAYEATTPVPLQPGRWESDGRVAERLAAFENIGEQMNVTFIRHSPLLWMDVLAGRGREPARGFSRHFFVNRTNGYVDGGEPVENRQMRIATVAIQWETRGYRGVRRNTVGRPTLDGINALHDAEMIRISYREKARFIHEVELDAARIARANP